MAHTQFPSSTGTGSGSDTATHSENARTRTPNSVLNGFQTNMYTSRRQKKRYTHVSRTNPVGAELDEACKKYPSAKFDEVIPDDVEFKCISDLSTEDVKRKIEAKLTNKLKRKNDVFDPD